MTKSQELFKRAVNRIPGGVNSPVRAYGAIGETPRFIQGAVGSSIFDVDGQKYLNESEEDANSRFTIPIADLTQDVPVIADTLAMGTPHEVQYVLTFDPASIASKSTLPQEGAKRVLIMAAVIIIGGGILNHFVNERRKQDYTGKRR